MSVQNSQSSVTAGKGLRGGLIRRLANDQRGAVIVPFVFVMIPVLCFVGAAIDYGRARNVQSKLQGAADAAALSTLNPEYTTTTDRQTIAQQVFTQNLAGDASLANVTPTIALTDTGATVSAQFDVPTVFMQFVQVASLPAVASSTVSSSSSTVTTSLEISMMIDLTGSMGQTVNGTTKIDGLKTAAADLLNIFFPNGATTSTNVRVGIVPMADFVNAGTYAATATGLSSTGSYAKQTNLASTMNGTYGNLSYTGAGGGGSGQGFGATSAGANYSNGFCTAGSQYLTVQGYTVGTSADRHDQGALQGQYAAYWKTQYNRVYYTLNYGYYIPTYASNCTPAADQSGHLITCVTERTGTDAYTDAAPASGSYIGAYNQGRTSQLVNYSSDGKCNTAGRELPQIIPMTNVKSTLSDFFTNATIGGGTPGHLGHAWAWYMLSPKWSSVWPTESQPTAYGTANVRKVAIIMTDGEYNEQYSSVASATQAQTLCTNMKTAGIEVFTIGFGFTANPTAGSAGANAQSLLSQCATDASHFFFPYDGTALRTAFQTIGQALTQPTGPRQVRMTN